VTASLRVIDAFRRSGRNAIRVLGASGQLGYGVPTPAFQAGLARGLARDVSRAWPRKQPLGCYELLQTKLRYFGGSVRAAINLSASSTCTSMRVGRLSSAM
jgi:hypothetical protein